jgi:hypothetical protein
MSERNCVPIQVFVILALSTLPYSTFAAEGHSASGHDAHGSKPTVKATVTTTGSLSPGKSFPCTLTLRTQDGNKPVTLDDLKEVHTEKIHLLIVDPSLDDYHHEHPVPLGNPGEYTFNFAPQRAGVYDFFVDIVPNATGIQEYVRATVEVPGTPSAIAKTANTEVTVQGYTFAISFAETPLVEGTPVEMTLNVTGRDGKPFDKLEPLMGAFAHFVAFSEDRHDVAHIHPLGEEPTSETQRGGPTLNAHLNIPSAGYSRLFAQVQIDGKNVFAPFGLQIDKRAEPKDAREIFNLADASTYALEQAVLTNQLSKVHGIAFETRDVLHFLPAKSTELSQEQQAGLAAGLKRIDRMAALLDKYGDAGDAAQTRQVLDKFAAEIAALRKTAGIESATAVKNANNPMCPVSGKAVGSMVAGAHADHKGYRVGLCCPACSEKFMAQADRNLNAVLSTAEKKETK